MPSTKHFKNLLGKNEKIIYKFTLSKRYLFIKMKITVLTSFLIILVLAALSFYMISFDNEKVSFDPQSGLNLDQASSEINNSVIYAWLILAAIYFLIILPIAWFYHYYYARISNQYVLTNQRVLVKRGWFNIKTVSIHYNRMTDASVGQDILDRILSIGTLSISTAGSEGYKIILSHIDKPNKIKQSIYNLREDYRQNLYNPKVERDFEHY